MIKKNKLMLVITSIVILIPMLIGVILWSSLPDSIAIHFDAEGNADGFAGKPFAVFALPAILFVIHWVGVLVTLADPKNKDIDGKPLMLVLWICPVMALLLCSIVYTTALGYNLGVGTVTSLVIGVLFIVIGNYLPKCKQNYTIGIKLPWTLADQENWNKTHRLAGILWVIGGVVIMATSFIGTVYVILPILLGMAVIPTVYSFCLYKKNNR